MRKNIEVRNPLRYECRNGNTIQFTVNVTEAVLPSIKEMKPDKPFPWEKNKKYMLICRLNNEGNPRADIEWFMNGNKIKDAKRSILELVPPLKNLDNSTFQCKISNKFSLFLNKEISSEIQIIRLKSKF